MTRISPRLLPFLLGFAFTPLAQAAVTTSFTLDNATIGTYSRAGSSESNYQYVYQYFTPSTTGSYTFGMDASAFNDPYMYFYRGSFDPNDPAANLIGEDDDGNRVSTACSEFGYKHCPQLTMNLDAGIDYYLVITTFNGGVPIVLPLSFFVTGDAAVGVGGESSGTALVPFSGTPSVGAAAQLDALRGQAGALQDVITLLDAMTPEAKRATLARIAPQSNVAHELALQSVQHSVWNSLSGRLHGLRAQDDSALALGLVDSDASQWLASNADAAGKATRAPAQGFWIQAFGGRLDQRSHAGYSGYDSHTQGMTLGLDTRLNEDWVAGAAFSYGTVNLNQQGERKGDGSDIDTYQLSAYASRDFGAWYLDGMLGYAQQRFETRRDTVLGGTAEGRFDGQQYSALLEAGLPLRLTSQATLTPLAGLEWSQLQLDNYKERHAGALGLDVDGERQDRLASRVGAHLGMDLPFSGGTHLQPAMQMTWRHELIGNALDTNARFIGGGNAFSTPGQRLPRDSYQLDLSLAMLRADGSSVSLGLSGDTATARSGFAGQLQAKWLF
ncbi:autotransporter outer membrane beta-barrel domain-containing protein [Metapseudomonas otitidis]|uniref:autotransporter outer membrane beta-barrel domain-containing protein n=1 Tax=Metapseudomonas otitidis TaxID=319939 RepID=UPI00227C8386|nr:autotransporter outer membrane beta-barrel domain-containing protein [Pseudomonas otitidis]WAF87557.1 autotransporter outer membrane beta-barrel domain-containing protein [Pseudomonas otitidis]